MLTLHHREPVCSRRRLTVVEPVPEAIESMLHEIFGRSKIKPGIDCNLCVLISNRRRVIFAKRAGWIDLGRVHTFVYNTFESWSNGVSLKHCKAKRSIEEPSMYRMSFLLITLNNLLEIAAAAMNTKMTTRKRPRVLELVVPLRKGLTAAAAAISAKEEKGQSKQRQEKL